MNGRESYFYGGKKNNKQFAFSKIKAGTMAAHILASHPEPGGSKTPVSGSLTFLQERVSWIHVLWDVCPWMNTIAVEGSRMIMDGGWGGGGKFSKAKGKRGMLKSQS